MQDFQCRSYLHPRLSDNEYSLGEDLSILLNSREVIHKTTEKYETSWWPWIGLIMQGIMKTTKIGTVSASKEAVSD